MLQPLASAIDLPPPPKLLTPGGGPRQSRFLNLHHRFCLRTPSRSRNRAAVRPGYARRMPNDRDCSGLLKRMRTGRLSSADMTEAAVDCKKAPGKQGGEHD